METPHGVGKARYAKASSPSCPNVDIGGGYVDILTPPKQNQWNNASLAKGMGWNCGDLWKFTSDERTFLMFGAQPQETRSLKGTVTLVGHFIYEKYLTTSSLFFSRETPPKKNALRKELAQQVLYQIQIARNQSHTSCLQILFQIWIEARLGEGSSVKICKRSYFQDSLCVDSYWSVDVRNWEFLPQLQTYKLCTSGLRPHQGLNFRFLNSWWETLGRVTEERLDS